jgi:hypothetical protein
MQVWWDGYDKFYEGHKEVQDTIVSWQVFWNSKGVIHVDFLPHGVTVNAQYYSNLLHNDVHQVIQKNGLGKCQRSSYDNTGPRMENFTKATLATMD